jgi:hypothetical protein
LHSKSANFLIQSPKNLRPSTTENHGLLGKSVILSPTENHGFLSQIREYDQKPLNRPISNRASMLREGGVSYIYKYRDLYIYTYM